MSEFAPVAVLIAFIMNALSCAVALDNAHMQLTYLEAGHRGNPGPAAVELDTSEADDLPPTVRPHWHTVDAAPAPAMVLHEFEQLAAPPARTHDAAVPYAQTCAPKPIPLRPIGWTSESLPFEQRNHEKPCQEHEKSVDAVPAHQEVAPQNQTQFAGHREYVAVQHTQ
jgi:hypothetical protein